MADGRHRRDRKRGRHAPTARHRRYKASSDAALGAPVVVVGAAAVAVAAVGGLNVAEAQSAGGARSRVAADVSIQAANKAEAQQRKREAEQRKREAERRQREADLSRHLADMYVLPVGDYRLTAGFGQSGSRWSNGHTGQDFAAPTGTAVRAVSSGVVTSAEWAGAYGWRVIIRHRDGTETWYCHLSSFVVRGGSVRAGQVIGRVGSTGNSTGPHLHLEVRVDGRPIDPMPWLRGHGLKP